jgi:alpha-tubulin suppressor-like RCC1 family protein
VTDEAYAWGRGDAASSARIWTIASGVPNNPDSGPKSFPQIIYGNFLLTPYTPGFIVAGDRHTLMVTQEGALRAWGETNFGQASWAGPVPFAGAIGRYAEIRNIAGASSATVKKAVATKDATIILFSSCL